MPHYTELTRPEHETNICPYCGTVVAVHDVFFIIKLLYFDLEPGSGLAEFNDSNRKYNIFSMNNAQQRNLRNFRFGMVYQNPHMGLNLNISAGGNIAKCLLMRHVETYGEIAPEPVNYWNG